VRNVNRIIRIRRWHSIRLDDLTRLRVLLSKAMPFIIVADHAPRLLEREMVISQFVETREQTELFQIAA
jgi:predicted DNA-binding helix-hairpin-helix protein